MFLGVKVRICLHVSVSPYTLGQFLWTRALLRIETALMGVICAVLGSLWVVQWNNAVGKVGGVLAMWVPGVR